MNDDDKILIVDDDEATARLLSEILRSEGFSTRECLSGPAALEALAQDDFQLVLLDIMMPGMNGFETCQRIRENSDVPVVFLTAKNEESDLVLGFSLGADDYIVKPFKPRELVARVRGRIQARSRSRGEPSWLGSRRSKRAPCGRDSSCATFSRFSRSPSSMRLCS